jgi:hypothetical protein
MPIEYHFPIPSSAQDLPVPTGPASKLFVCFISSTDPATNLPWCPDVRAALPRLEKTFSSHDAAQLAYVHVGQKPEYVAVFYSEQAVRHLSVLGGRSWTMCIERFGELVRFLRW